jgi:hypothetical protein
VGGRVLDQNVAGQASTETTNEATNEPPTTKGRQQCEALNRHGTRCQSCITGPDGRCAAHSQTKPRDPSAIGRAGGKASGAARRALRSADGKHLDESVRTQLRRQALKDPGKVVEALMRGMDASDPLVSTRSAVALLEQAFGRPGQAQATEDDPAKLVTGLFRRPAHEGQADRLYAVMRDGRILQVSTLSFDEHEPRANGPH